MGDIIQSVFLHFHKGSGRILGIYPQKAQTPRDLSFAVKCSNAVVFLSAPLSSGQIVHRVTKIIVKSNSQSSRVRDLMSNTVLLVV